jgi:hypothetical protein
VLVQHKQTVLEFACASQNHGAVAVIFHLMKAAAAAQPATEGADRFDATSAINAVCSGNLDMFAIICRVVPAEARAQVSVHVLAVVVVACRCRCC